MNGLFDVHMHINDTTYKQAGVETKTIIQGALDAGVVGMCCSGFDLESSKEAIKYATKYKSVFASVAVHPDKALESNESEIKELDTLCYNEKVVAIGEIGLDYHVIDLDKNSQKKLFIKQIEIAKKHDLPIILHLRDEKVKNDAYFDALEILKKHKITKGIVHCFTKDYKIAQMFIDQGFLISIGGVLTFPNSDDLVKTVEKISINNIVLETDAPYLAPVPNRGKLNLPEYIIHTANKIAELKKLNVNDVINSTTTNAINLFKIG